MKRPPARRRFGAALAAGLGLALLPGARGLRAQAARKLKVGVLLPRSGVMSFIGQSCQKGAELAPQVIREVLGVEVELMSADFETNVDTARVRAERLVQEGAHVLVGAVDSGATMAVAQVAEQRGVPLVVNIAASPVTDQGYRFVFRNFQTSADLVRNGLDLIGELFQATKAVPRSAVYMHVNDTFGQAMSRGIQALLPQRTQLPFRIVEDIGYDPAAKDLSLEVAKAKGAGADFLLLACRVNDSIVLRREMARQRWNPMGIISPGSAGMYSEQYFKTLGGLAEYSISNVPWYNPHAPLTREVHKAYSRRHPGERLEFDGLNVGFTFEAILIAADAFRRARSTDAKTLAAAIRATDIADRMMLGGPIRFNASGQVEGIGSACVQNHGGLPHVVLPQAAATARPVFPAPYYRKA